MAGENMSKLPGGGEVLRRLKEAGFKAYCVGGCVRDSVMGRPCRDIDITTDARPEEVIAVFGEKDTVPTGIRFGTVTVLREFEVTTFRIDGEYSDHRSPDNVDFTGSLEEDLSRRDFTMNAMAMDENGCITDPWEGRRDIERKVIRCVGDPEKRFEEVQFDLHEGAEPVPHGVRTQLRHPVQEVHGVHPAGHGTQHARTGHNGINSHRRRTSSRWPRRMCTPAAT